MVIFNKIASTIPQNFEKEVFIKNVKSICSSSGMVIFNKIASTIPQKYQAQRLLSVLQDNFPEVVSIDCSEITIVIL